MICTSYYVFRFFGIVDSFHKIIIGIQVEVSRYLSYFMMLTNLYEHHMTDLTPCFIFSRVGPSYFRKSMTLEFVCEFDLTITENDELNPSLRGDVPK